MDLRNCPVPLNPSLLPTDVTFVIQHCGSEVKAHKWIMALGSPVFLKQFYGDFKEKDQISIKETTKQSFVVMVDFLYGKEIDWKTISVEEMFDIANMAQKYHLDALINAVKKAFDDYPFTDSNVLACASLASEFTQFEDLSQALLDSSARFIKSKFVSGEDYEAFAAKYCDTDMSNTAFKLLGLMYKLHPKSCSFCDSISCRRGKPILRLADCEIGDKVKINPESMDEDVSDFQRKSGVEGFVLSKEDDDPQIVTVKLDDGVEWNYFVVLYGSPTFLFCKC